MLPQAPLIWLLISSLGDKVCVCVREGVRTACLKLWRNQELGEAFSGLRRVGVGKEREARTRTRIPSVGRAASET